MRSRAWWEGRRRREGEGEGGGGGGRGRGREREGEGEGGGGGGRARKREGREGRGRERWGGEELMPSATDPSHMSSSSGHLPSNRVTYWHIPHCYSRDDILPRPLDPCYFLPIASVMLRGRVWC